MAAARRNTYFNKFTMHAGSLPEPEEVDCETARVEEIRQPDTIYVYERTQRRM